MPLDDEVNAWVERAQADLKSADILLTNNPPILETAAFHCQQAAEKYLKAFLVDHHKKFRRIHNLVYLVELCQDIDPDLAELTGAAALLTPFAVLSRYPGSSSNPTPEQAQAAYKAAKTIAEAITDRL